MKIEIAYKRMNEFLVQNRLQSKAARAAGLARANFRKRMETKRLFLHEFNKICLDLELDPMQFLTFNFNERSVYEYIRNTGKQENRRI